MQATGATLRTDSVDPTPVVVQVVLVHTAKTFIVGPNDWCRHAHLEPLRRVVVAVLGALEDDAETAVIRVSQDTDVGRAIAAHTAMQSMKVEPVCVQVLVMFEF